MKKNLRSLLALALALTLCLGLAACGGNGDTPTDEPTGEPTDEPTENGDEPTDGPAGSLVDMSIPEGAELGSRLADFTFTTYDGKEMSLYETLEEKDMVLINIWASWCGPCQQEFPFMEAAYEANQDKVEIFALSCEEDDTDDVLKEYVEANGMTFPVGSDSPALSDLFEVDAIPTSIVVDRFGVICFIEANAQTAEDNFQRLFDVFTGDDYTKSQLLDGIPAPVCDVEPSSEADLAAALNVEGGALAFTNPEEDWPFTVTTDGDRSCVVSTNTNIDGTSSVISFSVDAKDGDALALDFKVSTEAGFDLLAIYVDDVKTPVKVFGGEHDWRSYAVELAAGSHTVELAYEKDDYTSDNDDTVYIDNIRILSGDDAAAALAANPVYPVSDETSVTPTNEDAKEIVFDDKEGILAANFGDAKYFIIPGDEAVFSIALDASLDPDGVTINSNYDSSFACLADILKDGAYTFTTGIDSMETTGYPYCSVYLAYGDEVSYCVYFNSEENVNAFVSNYLTDTDGTAYASWTYADGTAPGTSALPGSSVTVPAGYSEYTLVFVDQNGDPVPGVIANVCDDDACTPMTSNDDGEISFVYPSFAYHIQVIKVPEGYEYDTSKERYAKEEGDTLVFIVTKK